MLLYEIFDMSCSCISMICCCFLSEVLVVCLYCNLNVGRKFLCFDCRFILIFFSWGFSYLVMFYWVCVWVVVCLFIGDVVKWLSKLIDWNLVDFWVCCLKIVFLWVLVVWWECLIIVLCWWFVFVVYVFMCVVCRVLVFLGLIWLVKSCCCMLVDSGVLWLLNMFC